MMLNDEHEALRDSVRQFARDVVAPVLVARPSSG